MSKPGPAAVVPSSWVDLLERWGAHLRARGLSRATVETRLDHGRWVARAFPAGPRRLSARMWDEWSAGKGWRPETRRSVVNSVRQLCAFAGIEDVTGGAVVRVAPPCARPCPESVYLAALDAADRQTRLVLVLAAEYGLRRAEIASLRVDGLGADGGGRPTLWVMGKGAKPRALPITESVRDEILAIGNGEWVFPSRYVSAGGPVTARHLAKRARAVLDPPWTLHTLRHRFADRAYGNRDLIAVQRLLGHASAATTQRYLPVRMEALREATQLARVAS